MILNISSSVFLSVQQQTTSIIYPAELIEQRQETKKKNQGIFRETLRQPASNSMKYFLNIIFLLLLTIAK
jgi:hypothetical protein